MQTAQHAAVAAADVAAADVAAAAVVVAAAAAFRDELLLWLSSGELLCASP